MIKIVFKYLAIGSVLMAAFLLKVNAQGTSDAGNLDGKEINTITTAVPFLRIAPDARAAGMGDVSIALKPDANSIYWNAAKLIFAEKELGLAVSYTPWLRALVNDIYLAHLAGYKRLNKTQAIGLSLLYFNLGEIQFTDVNGDPNGRANPHEFNIDLAYSRKLSENFSTALSLKFIYSNLAAGQTVNGLIIHAGKAVAADIATYYEKEIKISENKAKLALGAVISNVGSKITYLESAERDFIPTNLGLGGSLNIEFDDYNQLTFALDINKLLTPTPDTIDSDEDGIYDYRTKSVVSGIFGSFADAPGGFGEEMRELMFSVGAEYWYANQFAVRAGYFYEHATKGNRKYLTAGLGLKFNIFALDVSYLIPSNSQRNPLDNTLRFTLSFDFEALKKENEAP